MSLYVQLQQATPGLVPLLQRCCQLCTVTGQQQTYLADSLAPGQVQVYDLCAACRWPMNASGRMLLRRP
jgi:hypothetical protein